MTELQQNEMARGRLGVGRLAWAGEGLAVWRLGRLAVWLGRLAILAASPFGRLTVWPLGGFCRLAAWPFWPFGRLAWPLGHFGRFAVWPLDRLAVWSFGRLPWLSRHCLFVWLLEEEKAEEWKSGDRVTTE